MVIKMSLPQNIKKTTKRNWLVQLIFLTQTSTQKVVNLSKKIGKNGSNTS